MRKKNRRAYLLAFLFLSVESVFALYVFNYTTRIRSPILDYESEEEISCIGISSSGDSFAIGGTNGSVSYFSRGKLGPLWEYHGASKVLSIMLSVEGDYIVTVDGNYTFALFSEFPFLLHDEAHPRWAYPLKNGTVAGVYSTGGIPPLVYILATARGRIQLYSNRGGLLWEYKTGTSQVVATLSSDGRWIAAADSDGSIYLFNINSAKPIWRVNTELTEVSLSLSQNKKYIALGGTTREGSGYVCTLSLDEGKLIWEWQTKRPVCSVSISGDGSRVVAYEEDVGVSVLEHEGNTVEEKVIRIEGGVKSIWSPPFGSYVLALNLEGIIYFFFLPRSAPLWKYNTGSEAPMVAVTSTGEHVFIATCREVAVVSNTFQTGFIPGSRGLWSVVFFVGVIGVITAIATMKGELNWHTVRSRSYLSILIGFFAGAVIGLFYYKNVRTLFIGGVGCAIGSFFGWKRGGVLNLVAGCLAGLISSMIMGYLIGLFYWFGGFESNIITLTLLNAINGGRFGVLFGIIGVFVGLVSSEVSSRI